MQSFTRKARHIQILWEKCHFSVGSNGLKMTDVGKTTNSFKQFFIGTKRNLPREYIYCTGSLLKSILLSGIFPNPKVFVDKKLKFPVHEILINYENLINVFDNQKPTTEALREFITNNFEDGKELELWTPPDWKQNPEILQKLSNPALRKWAIDINMQWTYLGRKVPKKVIEEEEELYSLIPVPHGFLIPGEKLKELYYWDSYWILNGLLKCNMWETARGIIRNFLYLVEKYGYIPSGTRIYFRNRSHPPLLTMMMESYLNQTNDIEFLKENIQILEKEMEFWKKNRSVTVRKKGFEYRMFRYKVGGDGPRPEAYKQDMDSGILCQSEEGLEEHLTALKSASESGWNLSTRWFILHGQNHGNITNIHTQDIIPVDLNAIIHRNYVLFSKWYLQLDNKMKYKHYECLADCLLQAIETFLWCEKEGVWLDYDLSNNIQRNYFYATNFVPLWTKSYRKDTYKLTESIVKYLNKYKLDSFPGGIPASLEDSGELWDFPNCWPPLQAFFIQGLDRLETKTGSTLAFHFAEKFIQNCYNEFKLRGTTLKFYDCMEPGYNIDDSIQGCGWSNGVIFEILDRWGDELGVSDRVSEDVHLIDGKIVAYENDNTYKISGTSENNMHIKKDKSKLRRESVTKK